MLAYQQRIPFKTAYLDDEQYLFYSPSAPESAYSETFQIGNMQSECLRAYRNNPIAHNIVETICRSVVNTGIQPSFYCKDAEKVNEQFNAFVRNIDFNNRHSFFALQRFAFRAMLLFGDCFFIVYEQNKKTTIRLVNGSQVNSEMSVDRKNEMEGIIRDANGRMAAICIYDPVQEKHVVINIYDKLGRQQIFQIANLQTTDQARGLPLLVPVIRELKQLERYRNTEIDAAIKSAFFSIYAKKNQPQQSRLDEIEDEDDENIDLKMQTNEMKLIDSNLELGTIESKMPTSKHIDFFINTARMVSTSLGVPLSILFMQHESSYSAARAANMQFMETIETMQQQFCAQFLMPIAKRFFQLHHPNTKAKVRWAANNVKEIDVEKAVNVSLKKIQSGISTAEEEKNKYKNNELEFEVSL